MFCGEAVQNLTKNFPTVTGIRWFNLSVLVITPVLSIYGLLYVPILSKTVICTTLYYIFSMLGTSTDSNLDALLPITNSKRYKVSPRVSLEDGNTDFATFISIFLTGYHRLWSHRSYNASLPLQIILILAGASAVQGSCFWWARRHRSHHRHTDTDLDPYNAERGLLWTHIGWMIFESDLRPGPADVSDLRKDPLVQWQHKWYFYILAVFGYLLPMVIPGLLWGDWRGGFFFVGTLRMTACHHVSPFPRPFPGAHNS